MRLNGKISMRCGSAQKAICTTTAFSVATGRFCPGRDIAPLNRKLRSIADMHSWVEKHIGGLFSDGEGRLLGFEAALVHAKRDGVTRLEVGEDVWASTLFDNSAEDLTRELARLQELVAPEID